MTRRFSYRGTPWWPGRFWLPSKAFPVLVKTPRPAPPTPSAALVRTAPLSATARLTATRSIKSDGKPSGLGFTGILSARVAGGIRAALSAGGELSTGSVSMTLAPAFYEFNLGWLSGAVVARSTVVRVFGWPYNWPGIASNILQGAHDLDNALRTYSGKRIKVFGHSMGSEVAYEWLDTYGPTAGSYASPSRVQFILSGNPQGKYGGIQRVPSPPFGTVYSYPGTPGLNGNLSPYPLLEVVRQYDYFADYPNVASPSQTARDNASTAIHGDYTMVDLASPANLVLTEGKITYMLVPTALDAATRTVVEASYIRPARVPLVGNPADTFVSYDRSTAPSSTGTLTATRLARYAGAMAMTGTLTASRSVTRDSAAAALSATGTLTATRGVTKDSLSAALSGGGALTATAVKTAALPYALPFVLG